MLPRTTRREVQIELAAEIASRNGQDFDALGQDEQRTYIALARAEAPDEKVKIWRTGEWICIWVNDGICQSTVSLTEDEWSNVMRTFERTSFENPSST